MYQFSKRTLIALLIFFFSILFVQCKSNNVPNDLNSKMDDSLLFAGETNFKNIKQLTFGGNNAEAYWSFDNKQLIFQSDWSKINNQGCDQIYIMNADGSPVNDSTQYQLVSTGKGRTTCSYFLPDGKIIFASTHEGGHSCPESQMFSGGRYVWPLFDSYDIYVADSDGKNTKVLIGGKGYDAEATVSPDGKFVIFTSTRSGDIELWRYEISTGNLLQLTNELGYDGGAFFSQDSKKIVWRASRPQGEDADNYKKLLKDGYVEPKALNIFIADIDGSNVTQVTNLAGANWAPYFHPSGNKILFCSNHHTIDKGGRIFNIFIINTDGSNLKQITFSDTFDAFPMFSHDGKKIVFASNRNTKKIPSRDTNVFIADWVD